MHRGSLHSDTACFHSLEVPYNIPCPKKAAPRRPEHSPRDTHLEGTKLTHHRPCRSSMAIWALHGVVRVRISSFSTNPPPEACLRPRSRRFPNNASLMYRWAWALSNVNPLINHPPSFISLEMVTIISWVRRADAPKIYKIYFHPPLD